MHKTKLVGLLAGMILLTTPAFAGNLKDSLNDIQDDLDRIARAQQEANDRAWEAQQRESEREQEHGIRHMNDWMKPILKALSTTKTTTTTTNRGSCGMLTEGP